MSLDPSRHDAVRQVKTAADIVDVVGECVTLKKAGSNFKGLCPFHQEKTPSFVVHPERQFFHCFGCGESGDVLAFVMKYQNLTFQDALAQLADRYHVTLPQKKISSREQRQKDQRDLLFQANEAAAALYHDLLLSGDSALSARRYLEKRSLPPEVIKEFLLGFAPSPGESGWDFLGRKLQQSGFSRETLVHAGLVVQKESGTTYDRFRNRVLCPIHDGQGRVVGFSGRVLDGDGPKYLNTSESDIFQKGGLLYGLFQNRAAIRARRAALLVEGNFDMLSLVAHGLRYVVAPLGTAVTRFHLRLLKPMVDEVVLLFDGDDAGMKAVQRTVPLFLAEELPARVVRLPEGEDPDSFIRMKGADALQEEIDRAVPLAEFVFNRLVDQYGLSLQGKSQIVRDLREIIGECASDLQRSLFISHFSKRLQLPESALQEGLEQQLRRQSVRQSFPANGQARSLSTLPLKKKQVLRFLILAPNYLSSFYDAGVAEILDDPQCGVVLGALDALAALGASASPEEILALLTDGEEKRFVARTFLQATGMAAGANDTIEEMAREMCAWLRAQRVKASGAHLQREILAAQTTGDMARLAELLERKKKIRSSVDTLL